MEHEWIVVYTAQGEFEETQVRSFLAAHGIPTTIRGEALRKTHGLTLDGLGQVEILVAPEHADEARRLLDDAERGEFTDSDAAAVYARHLQGLGIDNMEELTYYSRKRIHNLKYYTWVEQQGKTYEEIQKQWDDDQYWESIPTCVDQIDALIEEFNAKTGLLDKL